MFIDESKHDDIINHIVLSDHSSMYDHFTIMTKFPFDVPWTENIKSLLLLRSLDGAKTGKHGLSLH